MKPLQLKLTAFGPYKQTEIIDFRELGEHRLFVIAGMTGAGKTTIFDGICFALYGSASGEDRAEIREIRSHFAAENIHTSAELLFTIKGSTYRIFRQLAHKKKGNKNATGDKLEFVKVESDGEKPVVESQKLTEINRKMEELIGLSKDQFKQIVMLPQGEFRKLLTSETENKEAILRKIFKTESYRHLADSLKIKRDLAMNSLEKAHAKRDLYIKQIQSVIPERNSHLNEVLSAEHINIYQLLFALAEEVQYYQEQQAEKEALIQELNLKINLHHTLLVETKEFNKRLISYKEKEAELKRLEEQKEHFEQIKQRIENAKKASHIIPIEERYYEKLQEKKQKEQELAKLEEEFRLTTMEHQKLEVEFNEAKQNMPMIEQLTIELSTLQKLEVKLNELEKVSEKLSKRQLDVENFTNRLKLITADLETVDNQRNQHATQITSLHKQLETYDEKVVTLTELKEKQSTWQKWQRQMLSLEQLLMDEKAKKQMYETKLENYEREEKKWINNQASVLATKLVDGEPCPVCGSLEHRSLEGNHDISLTEQQLSALKYEADTASTAYFEYQASVNAGRQQSLQWEEELRRLDMEPTDGEKVSQEFQLLEQEVNDLKRQKKKLEVLRQEKQLLDDKREMLQQKYSTLELEKNSNLESFYQVRGEYESLQKEIPAGLSSIQALTSKIKELSFKKAELVRHYEVIEKKIEQSKNKVVSLRATIDSAEKNHTLAKQALEEAQSQFKEAVYSAGFDQGSAYQAARLKLSDIETLESSYEAYKLHLYALKEQIKAGVEEYAGQQTKDETNLERQLAAIQLEAKSLNEQIHAIKKYQADGHRLVKEIEESGKEIQQLEEKTAKIIDLYNVLRGQNSLKISFERFLQIEYLEQIIHAANTRLHPMSGGQYRLVRSDRQEARGKQSGLGLDVYDAYTGQKRDVKTLSGGEKFNASLSLALGMSDVIQSFQGNIQIDTMFIDEGFGTLDEEALNKAIRTLIDLQNNGRIVGIISHVAELKDAMPALLEVKKSKEGHSHTKFVLK